MPTNENAAAEAAGSATIHIHPATRRRTAQDFAALRLKCRALSGTGAVSLAAAIGQLERLAPLPPPSRDQSERHLAEAIAALLHLAYGRVTAWENGELPTAAESAAVVEGLTYCQGLLAKWESLIDRRGRG